MKTVMIFVFSMFNVSGQEEPSEQSNSFTVTSPEEEIVIEYVPPQVLNQTQQTKE